MAKRIKKIDKRIKIGEFSTYDFETSLRNVISLLQDYYHDYGDDADLSLDFVKTHDYYDSWDASFHVIMTRRETDEEAQERIDKEIAHNKSLEDQQRAQYELLKKKFEKN